MVTLKDIAIEAKSDSGTVSRVLRNHPKAQELRRETRERILRIAEELGYQPNLLASSVRTGIVKTVAMFVGFDPHDFSDYMVKVMAGVLVESARNGYGVKIYSNSDLDYAFSEISGSMIRYVVDASLDHEIREKIAAFCRAKKLKLVYLMEYPHGEFPTVGMDNFASAKTAVGHLIELGHTRIGLLCVPHRNYRYVRERHAGYLAALEEAGIESREEYISCTENHEEAIRRFLSLPEDRRPTAIFGITTGLLLAVERYVFRHTELRIPRDLALIGIGSAEQSNAAVVPITTLQEDYQQLGRIAFDVLLGEEPGIEKRPDGSYLYHAELVRKESTMNP